MYIEGVAISNLGIFQNLELLFSRDKINIIRGYNGCGKTTVLAVLYSILQEQEILQYKCEGKKAVIQLKICDKNNHFSIYKSYENGSARIMTDSFEAMKKLVSVDRDKIYLVSGEFFDHMNKLTGSMIQSVNQFLEEKGIENKHKIKAFKSEHKSYHMISGGEQAYYRLLFLLCSIEKDSVLLIDEPFAKLDYSTVNDVLNIMRTIDHVQFILTTGLRTIIAGEYNQIALEPEREPGKKYDYPIYDYKRVFYDKIRLPLTNKKEAVPGTDYKAIIKYELGKVIDEVEKRNVEFKEIKGNNPCNSIIDNGEIYINAFLNSRVSGVGVIKWGISDDGIVKGVRLSREDKDVINRNISERIGQMTPYVSTDSVQISFEGVAFEDEILQDIYVVEISVESVVSDLLFSTSKNDVYMKTDGGKRKLDSIEIQQELKRRMGLRY